MPSNRFNELQDEFIATSKRLREAKTPKEKMALLEALQSIVEESKRVLQEHLPTKSN